MAIRVELELVDGTFTTRMLHAGESIDRFNQAVARAHPQTAQLARNGELVFRSFSKVDQVSKGLLSTMRDYAVVFGAVSLAISKLQQITVNYVGKIVEVNSEFEKMTRLLAGMSTSANPMADATAQMANFRQMAREMPFSLTTIMNGAVKLKAVGMVPLEESIRSVGDAVAAFGGGDEAFNRAILSMNQMVGKGVVQMEELRQQLGEAIPRATELMARSMGISYAELMKQVATGTVESTHALQSMLGEFERTFGGAAQRQMTTFVGQIELLKTNLQSLALNVGGDWNSDTSFFGALKKQLRDLNFFLEGPQAKKFAEALGSGLQVAVNALRTALDFVIRFSSEIQSLAIIMAGAFGGQILVRGLASFMTYLGGIRSAWQGISMTVGSYTQEVLRARGAMTTIATGSGFSGVLATLQNMIIMITNLRANVASLRAVFGLLSSSLLGIAGIAPMIGMAIWGLAEYFDWFGQSTAEALAELDKLEDKSNRLEVEKKLKPALDRAKSDLAAYQNVAASDMKQYGAVMPETQNMIDQARKDVQALEARINAAVVKAGEEDIRRITAETRSALADVTQAINAKYDNQKNLIVQEAEAQKQAGGIAADIDAKMKEDLRKANEAYYAERIRQLNEFIAKQRAILGSSRDPFQIDTARAKLNVYASDLNQVLQQLDTFRKTGMEIVNVDTGKEGETAAKKLETALANTKDEAAGLRNQLMGGSKAMGELLNKINSGEFGDLRDLSVKTLVDSLVEAQKEVDGLKEALDFMNETQSDFDKMMKGMEKEAAYVNTQGMNPAEVWYQNYKKKAETLSPFAKMQLAVVNLQTQMQQLFGATTDVSNAFSETLFGPQIVKNGNNVVSILATMIGQVSQIGSGIRGIFSGGFMSFLGGGFGKAYTGGGGYFDALIGNESGGKSYAQNPLSSAAGLGQFTAGTWMNYIKAMHPEMLGMGFNNLLGLRSNNAMMMEALQWLTKNNANALTNAGYAPTNDNLYLSHFLGSGGALKVLGAGSGVSLADILGPQVMQANPFLMGKTTDWIKQWAANKMGNSAPWAGAQDAGISIPLTVDVNGKKMTPEEARDYSTKYFDDIVAPARGQKFLDEQKLKLLEIQDKAGDASAAQQELNKQIREGFFGGSRNPSDPAYKKYFDAINQLEEAEKKMKARREANNDVKSGLDENAKRIAKAAAAVKQAEAEADRNPYANTIQALAEINSRYDELIQKAKLAADNNPAKYAATVKQLEAQRAAEIDLLNKKDVTSTLTTLKEKETALRQSVGTERQVRQAELQKQLADLDAYKQKFVGTKQEEAQVTAQVEATKSALIAQYNQQNAGAFQQQMQQWGDLSTNLNQMMANAASSLADGLTSLIMGEKVDWKGMLKGMIKDLVNTGIKYLMSSIMGGKSQLSGMMGGKGGKGGKGKAASVATKGKGVGVMHTGGIVGRMSGATRTVSPLAFAGAHRFHTGGLIQGMGIKPGEVPIIARKGEGVFTPEQMQAMGRGNNHQSTAINTNVTVNSNGGDAKQNEDLAKQVAKQVEASVRGVVYKELRQQMRPGNMMGR